MAVCGRSAGTGEFRIYFGGLVLHILLCSRSYYEVLRIISFKHVRPAEQAVPPQSSHLCHPPRCVVGTCSLSSPSGHPPRYLRLPATTSTLRQQPLRCPSRTAFPLVGDLTDRCQVPVRGCSSPGVSAACVPGNPGWSIRANGRHIVLICVPRCGFRL